MPKISVIIPCFNQAHYLPVSVGSVLSQTFQDWECIIVNDGSSDATEKIGLEFAEKDKRIKYIKKENGGLSSARNKGLDLARGEFIQFLDADDMIDPEKFSCLSGEAAKADLIVSNFRMFNNDDSHSSNPDFILNKTCFNFKAILLGWDAEFVIPIHCGIFKSHIFSSIRFNENLTAREDWLVWLQVYQPTNIHTVFIDKPLAFYRLSPGSMSQNNLLMDRNLVKVYQLIYSMVPAEYRELFFQKVMVSLGGLLDNAANELVKAKQSKSYRLGNFFIRKYNWLKKTIS